MQLPRLWSWAAAALLFFPAAAFADPRPLPLPGAKETPDFAAGLREEWTELRVEMYSPRFRRRLGLTIRRVSTPLSLSFTMQPFTATETGVKAWISYEQVTGALKELLKRYQAGVAERIPIEFARDLPNNANPSGKWPPAVLSMELHAPSGKLSGSVAVRDGMSAICMLLASLAEVDKAPRNPGTPPQEVEALLRSEWTELRVGGAFDPGCLGLRDHGVLITKTETGFRVEEFHDRGDAKGIVMQPPAELPLTDRPKLEADVLKIYQAAYGDYAGAEQSIGWDVASGLRSAILPDLASGAPAVMFVQVKTKDGTKSIRNYIGEIDVLANVLRGAEQLGKPR